MTQPRDDNDGPWNELRRATLRRPGARVGLVLVAAFVAVALLAPILCHRLPFAWFDNATQTWSYPLVREFFAPTDTKETGLEAAANFALLFSPLAWIAWKAVGRWRPGARKTRSRLAAMILGVLGAAALWYGAVGVLGAVGGASPWVAERHSAVDPDDLREPQALAATVLAWPENHPARRALFAALRNGTLRFFDADENNDAALESAVEQFIRAHGPDAPGAPGAACAPAAAPTPADAARDDDRPFRLALAGLLNDALREQDFPVPPGLAEGDTLVRELAGREAAGRLSDDDARRLRRFYLDASTGPRLLRPAREWRTGLIAAAAATALALAGVTAMILLAAHQLSADPRWMALLALAALLAIPFVRAKPFNETRRFRELAAAGKGRGYFPPLPYGPSEDGFGPKLPPDWRQPPTLLSEADVLPPAPSPSGHAPVTGVEDGWEAFADWLAGFGDDDPRTGKARRHLRGALAQDTAAALEADGRALFDAAAAAAMGPAAITPQSPPSNAAADAGGDLRDAYTPDTRQALIAQSFLRPDARAFLLRRLNALIEGPALFDADAFRPLRLDHDYLIEPYLAAERPLTAVETTRLNRLLLERALPGTVRPAKATHWKQPLQKPGVHWLGTDESGRDVLARMLHGARVSLSVGFVSVALATLIGLVLGALAAYYGGWIDHLVMRAIEIMMCIPTFFLLLALIAILEQRSILNIMLVLGLTGWTGVARLVRGEMLKQRSLDYVSAARALGASDSRIMFRHILPNAVAPVLVSVTFGITGAILSESGLSFLGLGVMPPTPSWGQLLAEAREAPLDNWWLALFPGLALFVSVFSYNLVGEGLRDAMDPRQR